MAGIRYVKLLGMSQWKQNQKSGLSPVGVCYAVSVLLFNCHTYIRGRGQVSERFNCLLPSLVEYLFLETALPSREADLIALQAIIPVD